jgi:hypothetical protein
MSRRTGAKRFIGAAADAINRLTREADQAIGHGRARNPL